MLDTIAYLLLGLILLFVPGFLFSLALFPGKDSLDFWERVGVSLGLGVLVLIYLGFVLTQPGLKMLTLVPFVLAVFGICLLFALIAYWRRGLEVAIIYERALMRKISRLRPPKRKPAPPEEKPIPPELPTPPEEKPAPPPEERPAQPPQPPQEKRESGEGV